MFRLIPPSPEEIARFRAAQARLDFTYREVGGTQGTPPSSYNVDHTRAKLGSGEELFERAVTALWEWRHFDLGWVRAEPHGVPLETGECVVVVARLLGTWWLNCCRIVYTLDEDGPTRRFGFAYGTLPGHAEQGEERCLVELDGSGDVWYDILAFSRPRNVLARIGYPVARRIQKQFARDSAQSMLRVVQHTR